MTKIVRVMKAASDLKRGDMFIGLDLADNDFLSPRRILDIKTRDGGIRLHLDNLTKVTLHDEQVVIVECLA